MILLLNGAACAGKSSLARALQGLWPRPLMHAGIDDFSRFLPSDYMGFDPEPGDKAFDGVSWRRSTRDGAPWLRFEAGAIGEKWLADMRRILAFMAGLGYDLVIDEMLIRREWVVDYRQAFDAFEVWLIGVRCPLEILVEREIARGGGVRGQARSTFAEAHAHCVYDLEVDTGALSPYECAKSIVAHIGSGAKPAAFKALGR